MLTLGDLVAVDYPEIDLANPNSTINLIQEIKPDIIVNAAAYTNVDKAENEPRIARLINGIAPGVIAEQAYKMGAAFIHYSTDFVFDGKKGSPYIETDLPHPINVYGATKLEGEQAIQQIGGAYLIYRTSWVYSMRQGGFVTKVLQWAHTKEVLRIVDDQFGSPTWARILAEATTQVIAQGRNDLIGYMIEKAGIYHLAGAGIASRYEWAKAIVDMDPNRNSQIMKEILHVKTSEFPTVAIRPNYSALENTKIKMLNLQIMNWLKILKYCMG
jgi:dTDP-4-dehydrorhamnose reductase